ncbi:MAG: class IV adenylate cyclase [Vicinamibacterales bacterium]
MVEREVKLRFVSPDAARAAILAAGAIPLRARRLQVDVILDTNDETLRRRHCVLRIRAEAGTTLLTFKGPVRAGSMKIRDEHETVVDDGEVLRHVFSEVGLLARFRSEKYREEFTAEGVVIAIDETPVGTFVEIEGSEEGILTTTKALGCTPKDFVLDSYRQLFVQHRGRFGLTGSDMVFGGA